MCVLCGKKREDNGGIQYETVQQKENKGATASFQILLVAKKVFDYCPQLNSVIELGCFDGKTLDFLPNTNFYYEGYDANWEGGLDLGRENLKERGNCELFFCDNVQLFQPKRSQFDISICMETLEHLPLEQLEPYIQQLAKYTGKYCFVTIPNEGGIVFLTKYFIKKVILRSVPEPYTTKEILLTVAGKMTRVKRNEGGHKGFDYKEIVELLSKYFSVESVEGIPFRYLSRKLNFTIGIVLKRKD